MPLEKENELHHKTTILNNETSFEVFEEQVISPHSDLHFSEGENATHIGLDIEEENKPNHVIFSTLNISPRAPRECTIDDILAIQRYFKKKISNEDNVILVEGDRVNMTSQHELIQYDFTEVKTRGKIKQWKQPMLSPVPIVKSNNLFLTSFLVSPMHTFMSWNIIGMSNGPSL